jgi:hypothetical protein
MGWVTVPNPNILLRINELAKLVVKLLFESPAGTLGGKLHKYAVKKFETFIIFVVFVAILAVFVAIFAARLLERADTFRFVNPFPSPVKYSALTVFAYILLAKTAVV